MPFPDGHYYAQAESGGSLLEKNCHDFDLMSWLAGADPVRVCAFGGQHVFTEETDVNDHAVVIVEYENGVRASLDLCLYAPYGDWHPEFHGRRDYLQMRTFLLCLDGRAEPPASVTDAKRVAAIALGAERSILEGEIVEIDSRYDLR